MTGAEYIELDLVLHGGMVGIIVCRPSGIRWSNQACGYWCEHPSAEGIFLPLPDCIPADRLKDVRYIPSDEAKEEESDQYYDRGRVQAFLDTLAAIFTNHRGGKNIVEFEALERWPGYAGEAWVPCRLKYADEASPATHLTPFVGSDCIIVYENSD